MKRMILSTLVCVGLLLSSNVFAQDLTVNGFAEGAFGNRVSDNTLFPDKDYTLNETRLQLQLEHTSDNGSFFGAVDFLADNVSDDKAQTTIREAYAQFSLGRAIDVKVGRQILTWGTGDLLFINDVFPKDFISFFVGREDQYLKHPSDAIKLGLFLPGVNVDFIASSAFQPDLLPGGERLSSFNPLSGSITGSGSQSSVRNPGKQFNNTEIAIRLYKYMGSFQVAGYTYRGFFSAPMGIDPAQNSLYYPDLSIYGASIRGPLLSGVVSAEYGFYDSRDDRIGIDPFIPNSQHKFLLGLERQFWTDFTAGVQYYNETYTDYSAYTSTLPVGSPMLDEMRHLVTSRLTQLVFYQNVTLSLFTFYSPSDEDWHIRPAVSFKYSDAISFAAGANFFSGTKNYTLFGQFEDNNNAYARVRYYF